MINYRYTVFLSCFLLFGGCSRAQDNTNHVCVTNNCVEVTIASDKVTRMKGLMDVEHLPKERGMLFVFPHATRQGFWMKNTLIPLDIVWISRDRAVVDVSFNTPPCKKDPCSIYVPKSDALYVLEVNAGVAKQMGITIGEKLDFRLKDIN